MPLLTGFLLNLLLFSFEHSRRQDIENRTQDLTSQSLMSEVYRVRKCRIFDEEGWLCDKKLWLSKMDRCIPLDWVCDGYYQCEYDNSDEELGCKVFQ